MRTLLASVVVFAASFFLFGCASSQTYFIHLSLPVVNETQGVISKVEIRPSKSSFAVVSKATNIPPGEKTILSIPLFEGWNSAIAYQGSKVADKVFFVENGDIVEFLGNDDTLDRIIFRPEDFMEKPHWMK